MNSNVSRVGIAAASFFVFSSMASVGLCAEKEDTTTPVMSVTRIEVWGDDGVLRNYRENITKRLQEPIRKGDVSISEKGKRLIFVFDTKLNVSINEFYGALVDQAVEGRYESRQLSYPAHNIHIDLSVGYAPCAKISCAGQLKYLGPVPPCDTCP
jgi:hypothetical protein